MPIYFTDQLYITNTFFSIKRIQTMDNKFYPRFYLCFRQAYIHKAWTIIAIPISNTILSETVTYQSSHTI